MTTSLLNLLLINPIFDALVDHLNTIDLLRLRLTNRSIYHLLTSATRPWRAVSFFPSRNNIVNDTAQRHQPATIYDSHITSHSHNSSNQQTQKARYIRDGAVVTFLGKTLPLAQYTVLDLRQTNIETVALRNLLDQCVSLRYLNVSDCPCLAMHQVLIAMYGLERRFVERIFDEYRVSIPLSMVRSEVTLEGSQGLSLPLEWLGRDFDCDDTLDINNDTLSDKYGSPLHNNHLFSVHQNTADQLVFFSEVHRSLAQAELRRVLMCGSSQVNMYWHQGCHLPPIPKLRRRPFELKQVITSHFAYKGVKENQPWLMVAAMSKNVYLVLLCHLMGIELGMMSGDDVQAAKDQA